MKITALMDNIASEHKGLIAEHGLSYFVDTGETQLLFDCGGSSHPFLNAEKMNLSLSEVETVVLSHGHYDHAAGFKDAMDVITPKRLITGTDFFEEKYAYDGIIATYLGTGFGEEFVTKHKVEHVVCEKQLKLDNYAYVISDFKRETPFETIPERFVIRKENQFIKDDFHDEVCLVIESEKGLVVVLGCSHPGVLNMLSSIQNILKKPIYAVFGGTHLIEADEKRIECSLQKMKEMGVGLICMSHCSGNQSIEMAKEFDGIQSVPLSVGSTIII